MRKKIAVELGGGHESRWTQRAMRLFDVVHIVEPFGVACATLAKGFKWHMTTGRIVIHKLAISDYCGETTLNLCKAEQLVDGAEGFTYGGSSLKERMEPERKFDNDEAKTKVVTWDTFLDMAKVSHVDVAHVDIEGSEEEFLNGMTKGFPKEMFISVYHGEGFKNCVSRQELLKMLEDKGYVVEEYLTDTGEKSTIDECQEVLACHRSTRTDTES